MVTMGINSPSPADTIYRRSTPVYVFVYVQNRRVYVRSRGIVTGDNAGARGIYTATLERGLLHIGAN